MNFELSVDICNLHDVAPTIDGGLLPEVRFTQSGPIAPQPPGGSNS
jgi:hypothetical protein